MALCGRCGADNPPDFKFCKYCGTPAGGGQAPACHCQDAQSEDAAERIEAAGDRFGEKMDRWGERFGRDIFNWWDTTLGVLSPIIMGFFGIILMLFGLFVTDLVESRADNPLFWRELGDFTVDNFLLLVGLMFLGSFHGYFYRRYRMTYRWIGPILSAAIVTLWAWVLAQLLMIAGQNSEHHGFFDAGELLESLLVAIFVLGILVAYAILWFSLVSPVNWDKPERKN